MAVMKNGKIVANKNAKKLPSIKLKGTGSPYKVGTLIWFIGNELRLFEGKIVKTLPNGFFECSVQNKNIHKGNEWQTAIVEEEALHILKD